MRIRMKYVRHWVDKKTGRPYARLRRPGFPEISLPGLIGSPEFLAGYHAAMRGETPTLAIAEMTARNGTISHAVNLYLSSNGFLSRVPSEATRERQISTLKKFCDLVGNLPLKQLDEKYIRRLLGNIASIGVSRTTLITLKPFLRWAMMQQFIDTDPTIGIVIKPPKSNGHATATEDQIAQFEMRWPLGTRERLLFALLLYTGQRCSDIRKLGPHSIVNGAFPITQQKTGAKVVVPVISELQAAIDACNVIGIYSDTFLGTKSGRLINQRSLNKWFRRACDEAGLPATVKPHGLRKACCRRLAQAGCSVKQIQAISGHLTLKEIERYTRDYDNEQGARDAFAKLSAVRAA